MEWQIILLLAVAITVILFPVAYVWGLTIGGIYAVARKRRIAKQVRVALSAGIYCLAMAFLTAGFGWEIGLAVTLAIPVIFIPVAFVWYLTLGGIGAAVLTGASARVGRGVQVAVPFVLPVCIYVFLTGFLGFAWELALAVTLGIPVMIAPAAFAWYLSASGLVRVALDARRRQKRRAQMSALRGAGVLVRAR